MNINLINFVLIISICFFASSSYGHPLESGSKFLQTCSMESKDIESTEETLDHIYCIGFSVGVFTGVRAATEKSVNMEEICLPDSAEGYQLEKIIVKWMNDNPKLLHINAQVLSALALLSEYKCENN